MAVRQSEEKKQFAKYLRNNMTKFERFLWFEELRKHRHKWRRQYTVDPFILDFYCEKLKLAIELDGSHHIMEPDVIEYDKRRTEFLEERGITVVRFFNGDFISGYEFVLQEIEDAVVLAERRMGV